MRLRNKPWASEMIANHPQIVEPDPKNWKGRWSELFENDHPLHVEVGTGKGRFVTRMGEQYPERNIIGVEKFDSVIITGVERLIENPQENVRLLKEDVNEITDFFGEKEVDRLYINFTDPWPKNRHAKRRLTHEGFLQKYAEILKEDGEIHFKTDNQGLFEYSIESMTNFGFKLKNVSLDLHKSEMKDNVMTEYEEKFSSKGMRIYRLEAYL
ncbi:tRNA (guanosine(46)-N7)-methyltransferase TrmB [Bacillus shivajii]|uniref:tRNA (guanosine(46)-N7)-methyltransferase TrmB n=1 Tax=Bacillus shivajii TaxID=1983719 RepID=UPI001CFB2D7C|nr:tRNA (guanosine(46)-N7)-methyltransferase TrmB [Bacillus shivajii]UCZ52329.1 tRNA (guanosine(46)-N7)-methyltransferase TrmB [Bacillus shivajii]